MYPLVVHSARGSLTSYCRYHPDDVEGIAERRRIFVTEKLAYLIKVNLAESGPLTDDQVSRLTELLRNSAAGRAR